MILVVVLLLLSFEVVYDHVVVVVVGSVGTAHIPGSASCPLKPLG